MAISGFTMSGNCGMNLKLIAVITSTILIIAIILTGVGNGTLEGILSIFLVFVFPGYALVKALFPGGHLEFAERVALTLGLSLAIVSIGGLFLNWLPWKLATRSWMIFLGSIIIFTSLIALLRQQPIKEQPSLFTKVNLSFTLNDGLFFILAGIGVVIAFVLTYRGEIQQNNAHFTQLWTLPDQESESSVLVGIKNQEGEEVRYRLQMIINGEVFEEIPVIDLESEETWEMSFTLPLNTDSVRTQIYRLYEDGELCREDNPPEICLRNDEVYREVVLWK